MGYGFLSNMGFQKEEGETGRGTAERKASLSKGVTSASWVAAESQFKL